MRLAGSGDVYRSLSDGLDVEIDQADTQDSKLDSFLSTYELLVSKGFSQQAAEETAMSMVEGREPMAHPTLRFAMIYGDPNKDDISSSSTDQQV